MVFTKKEVRALQNRVMELEHQLAEAQAALRIFSSPGEGDLQANGAQYQAEELNAIIQTLHDPVMVYDQTGVIYVVNASAIRAHGFDPTGYHRQETNQTLRVHYPSGEKVSSDDLPSARALKGETVVDEAFIFTNSLGQELSILVTASPLIVNGVQKGVVSVWHDITDRKLAEENLRTARDEAIWLARLPGENPNPVVRVSREGIVLYNNPLAAKLPGWTCMVDSPLPAPLLSLVQEAIARGHIMESDILLGERFYSVSVIPIRDEGYANLYGKDITARKQVEKQLQESEQKYALLFGKSAVPAVLLKLPEVVIVDANEALEKLIGYTRQEMYGKTAVELGILEAEERTKTIAEFYQQGSFAGNEKKLFTKNGEERVVALNTNPLTIGEHRYAISTMQDITERKRAEKALVASKNRIHDILESVDDGLLALDKKWLIIYVNQHAAQIAGYSVEELVGKNLWELWPQLRGTALESFYRQAMEDGIPGQFRTRGVQSDRWYDVNVYPSSEGITIFYLDKTQQIQGEEALRKSEERFAKAFHASPSALVISRQEDGWIEAVNDRFINFFGYNQEEVIGKTSTELGMFVHQADRQEAVRRLQKEGAVRDFELEVRLKSGEVRSVTLSVEIIDIGGRDMMLTAIQDITQRKQAEEALRESEERFRAVIENALDAIVVTDPSQDGKVLAANPAACRMFDYSVEEFLGLERDAILDTTDPRLAVFLKQRNRQGQVTGQLSYKRKDGTVFLGEVSSVFYQDQSGEQRAIAIIRDITERKETERALQASEAKMRAVFRALVEGVVFLNPKGEVEATNDAVQHTFGHTFQALTDPELDPRLRIIRSDGSFFPVDEQPAMVALRTGEAVRDVEMGVPLSNGKISWQLVNAQPVYDDQGTLLGAVASFFDITDRKQYEIALRKRESILAQAGEIAHLGAWDIEFHDLNDVNANPLNWSDEVYRIFGYVPGEVQPSNELFFERVHPDDRALVQESVAQAIATRYPYKIEHRVRRPDGEERIVQEHAEVFFDEAGNPLRIVGAVQDITERKRAEKASRESEQRFRSLADSMPQLVWTAQPDGTVDYYNQRYHEYWGIKQIEGAKWEWSPVLHPDDFQTTIDAWQHSVETGEVYQIEHQVRMADGSYRWHLSRGIPMLNEKGQIVRWFGTATNIHDLKLAEEQLKVYTERLERSNRELEQFAFMASHDLQEPLRKIEVFGDLLLESSKSLSGRERNYLDRMRDAAKRMRDMVDGLLQLSRVTTQGKPFVQVSLSQVMEDVLSTLENQIRRTGGKVEVGTLPAIDCDPLQMRQLMQNLIGNALKYHQPETPPEVKIHAEQLSGKVQIRVEDQGIGFEQAEAERIFQPFQRLVGRSQYEGSGMGLAICRRIVERHGGEITARSQPGDGTTFIVTLPIYQSKGSRKDASHEEPGATSGR